LASVSWAICCQFVYNWWTQAGPLLGGKWHAARGRLRGGGRAMARRLLGDVWAICERFVDVWRKTVPPRKKTDSTRTPEAGRAPNQPRIREEQPRQGKPIGKPIRFKRVAARAATTQCLQPPHTQPESSPGHGDTRARARNIGKHIGKLTCPEPCRHVRAGSPDLCQKTKKITKCCKSRFVGETICGCLN